MAFDRILAPGVLLVLVVLCLPALADDTVLAQFISCGTQQETVGKPMTKGCRDRFLHPDSFRRGIEEKLAFLLSEKPAAIIERPCELAQPQSKCAELHYSDGAKYLVVYTIKDRKIDSLSLF